MYTKFQQFQIYYTQSIIRTLQKIDDNYKKSERQIQFYKKQEFFLRFPSQGKQKQEYFLQIHIQISRNVSHIWH